LPRHAFTVFLLAALPALATPAESGQLDASPSLFTVMAAINAAGYRAEWSSPNNHPVRFQVQAELAKRNIPSLPALKEFFESHRQKTRPAGTEPVYFLRSILQRAAGLRVRHTRRGDPAGCAAAAPALAPAGGVL
jgi:hypothetical protein